MNEHIVKRTKSFKTLGLKSKARFDFRPFLDLDFKTTIEKEFIFCITTANSTAKSGLIFQKKIEKISLDELMNQDLGKLLKESKVRFHKRKAMYIKEFLKNIDKFYEALEQHDPRPYLLRFKGIGPKEASHFLRNIGRFEYAIIDRHIIRFLESRFNIKVKTSPNYRQYLSLEKLFSKVSRKHGLEPGVYDLVIWYKATGKVLK